MPLITGATLLFVGLFAGCGSDTPTTTDSTTTTVAETTTTPTSTADTDPDAGATGTVTVRLEEVGGVFIEGFEVGLRFEDADGNTIASTLWSDFVNAQGAPSPEDYYESVLEQKVPAGTVVVLATANVGAGPGPVIPDVEGDLRCRLQLDVPEGETVDVEVTFNDPVKCLRPLGS